MYLAFLLPMVWLMTSNYVTRKGCTSATEVNSHLQSRTGFWGHLERVGSSCKANEVYSYRYNKWTVLRTGECFKDNEVDKALAYCKEAYPTKSTFDNIRPIFGNVTLLNSDASKRANFHKDLASQPPALQLPSNVGKCVWRSIHSKDCGEKTFFDQWILVASRLCHSSQPTTHLNVLMGQTPCNSRCGIARYNLVVLFCCERPASTDYYVETCQIDKRCHSRLESQLTVNDSTIASFKVVDDNAISCKAYTMWTYQPLATSLIVVAIGVFSITALFALRLVIKVGRSKSIRRIQVAPYQSTADYAARSGNP